MQLVNLDPSTGAFELDPRLLLLKVTSALILHRYIQIIHICKYHSYIHPHHLLQ